MKKKVVIVDDEPRAHIILENYLARLPEVQLVGKYTSARAALDFLRSNHVDIVLLDITMPETDGFELLRALAEPPLVIFTTAHSEYALESYEYNAVDYLKKPIPFERFQKAIGKALSLLTLHPAKSLASGIQLRIEGETMTFAFDKILYLQSLGNYVKIYTPERMWLTQLTTRHTEESLPKELFIRIHKSFIVNKSKIEHFTDDEVVINRVKLPIGKTFKKYVRESLL